MYLVQYRLGGRKGRTRRVTIGQHGELTPTMARAEAKRLLGEIAIGRDPANERDKRKADKSVEAVLDHFMAEHVKPKLKASTAREYQRIAKLHIVPRLGRRPIGELKRQDIAKLHHELAEKPYQANRTLALLSKFFNWTEKNGLRPDGSNPCRHVEKYREGKRERFLSQAELARLGDELRKAEKAKTCSTWAIAGVRLLIGRRTLRIALPTARVNSIKSRAGNEEAPETGGTRGFFGSWGTVMGEGSPITGA
ncbi:MAG: integrase arm-type DNA-binding domain-containing protein [Methyloceanibacter sp.]|nr:integrase arm-type DNA-binding domain-containing protein [Methyloceanibacter sp.]